MHSLWIDGITEKHQNAVRPLTEILQVTARLQPLMEELSKLTGTWNLVELYTATNAKEERRTFLDHMRRGEPYTPRLQYPHTEAMDITPQRTRLMAMREQTELLSPLPEEEFHVRRIMRRIDDDLATCDFIEGIQQKNDARIADALHRKYPTVNEWLLEKAQQVYEETCLRPYLPFTVEDQGSIHAEEVKHAFEETIARYPISGKNPFQWKIIIDPAATAVDVRDKSSQGPCVVIPAELAIPEIELRLLMVHEVEAHVRQTLNGWEAFGSFASILRLDDETLYEGLAVRHEIDLYERLELTEARVRFLASISATTFAVQLAEQGAGFQEVYEDQLTRILHVDLRVPANQPLPPRSTISEEIHASAERRACSRTYRIMRGHTDCTNRASFAMTKDLAYFRGWLLDKALVENGIGYLNELSILSLDGLDDLAGYQWDETALKHPYTCFSLDYTKKM